MDTEWFLTAAAELLALPSTFDRPDDLSRALGFVLGFVGPGFTVERYRIQPQAERAGLSRPAAIEFPGDPERAP